MNSLGVAFAVLGAVCRFDGRYRLCKGVGIAGEAAAGVIAEDPGKFGKLLVAAAFARHTGPFTAFDRRAGFKPNRPAGWQSGRIDHSTA